MHSQHKPPPESHDPLPRKKERIRSAPHSEPPSPLKPHRFSVSRLDSSPVIAQEAAKKLSKGSPLQENGKKPILQRSRDEDILPFLPGATLNAAPSDREPIHILTAADEQNRESAEGGEEAPCCTPWKIIPALAALKESADIAMSLSQNHNTSVLKLVVGTSSAFICEYELTGETSTQNSAEARKAISTRTAPAKWETISTNKMKIAFALTTLTTPWGVFAWASEAFYFISSLRTIYHLGDSVAIKVVTYGSSSLVACAVGVNKMCTDNWESLKTVIHLLSGKRSEYANVFSRIFSPLIGVPLGVLKALQNSVLSYIAITNIFNIKNGFAKTIVGLLSLIDAVPNFCFEGLYNINALDEFFGYLQKAKIEPIKIAALLFSLTISVYFALLKRNLNKGFYKNVATDFGKELADDVYEMLSWSIFIQESIQGAASLTEPMYSVLDKLYTRTRRLVEKITACCRPNEAVIDNEAGPLLIPVNPEKVIASPLPQEDDLLLTRIATEPPPSGYRTGNANLLFNRDYGSRPPQEKEEKTFKLRCGIL